MPTDTATRQKLKRYIESRQGSRAGSAVAEGAVYTGEQGRQEAARIIVESRAVPAKNARYGNGPKPKRRRGRPSKDMQSYPAPAAADSPNRTDWDALQAPPPEIIDAEFEKFLNEEDLVGEDYGAEFKGPGWEELDFRQDHNDYETSGEETEYGAAETRGKLAFNPITMFFRDTRHLNLLDRKQEKLYGERIKTYGPEFIRGILLPGHGTASVARLIYTYFTKPDDFVIHQKFPGLGVRKNTLLSKGPEAFEAAKKFVQGENDIITRLLKEDLSDRGNRRLRHDMDSLQHQSRETLLPFEPSLGAMDIVFKELAVYAQRIRVLNEELRGNGSDETLRRYLLHMSSEAGDIPDRFPDFIGELAHNRGVYLGARDRLAKGNLRLVCKVANQYRGGRLRYEDLIGHGMTGLMRAVDKFKPEMGYKFSTYAWWWIRQAITRALWETSRRIKIPPHALKAGRRIWHARNMLYQFNEREPTTHEIAKHLGMNPELVERYGSIPAVTSYSMPIMTDSDDKLVGFLEDENIDSPYRAAERQALSELVEEILNEFDPRDADVIRRRHGIGKYNGVTQTLQEIGEVHEVTRERIRQLEYRVKQRLLHPKRKWRLEPFLDKKE